MALSTFCSADYSSSATSSSQRANIEASYGLFSGGAGGATDSAAIIATQRNVCTSGFNSTAYSNRASSSARTVYQGSLDAWTQCLSLVGKGIDFQALPDSTLQGITATVTASPGMTAKFMGITQIGSGRSNCTTTLPARSGSLSGQVITVDQSTSFDVNSNVKLTITCNRELDNDGSGNLSADAETLVFNTSAGPYRVPLEPIGRLSRVTVDQAMSQIRTVVAADTNAAIASFEIVDSGVLDGSLSSDGQDHGAREVIVPIRFSKRFSQPPKVYLVLSAFDTWSYDHDYRLYLYASDVTNTGFNAHVRTWAVTAINWASATWIAHGK